MKKWCIISTLLVAMAIPTMGCSLLNNNGTNWRDNVPQLTGDVFTLSKLVTRIALSKTDMSAEDVGKINSYLVALRDLLAVPGQPDFTGARNLVATLLPPKYYSYGFIIIDVLERYLLTIDLNITDDQELISALISSGIEGALASVQEFTE
jgi:hypothetical protein